MKASINQTLAAPSPSRKHIAIAWRRGRYRGQRWRHGGA
jgi:hypothetical protein